MRASFVTSNDAALRRRLGGRRSLGLALMLALLLAALPLAASADTGPASGGGAGQAAAGGTMTMPAIGMADVTGAGLSLEMLPAGDAELLDAGQGQTVVVHIHNFSFGSPLSVAPGTTVQWLNDDSVTHTVTADDGTFDSGNLAPGASFQITFTQPGFYPYYCQFHGGPGGQGMSSMVTVTQQAAGAEANPSSGGATTSGKNAVPNYGGGMSSGGTQNAAPGYGSGTTPKYGAAGTQGYSTKKTPVYGGAPKRGYTSQSTRYYKSYKPGRYVVPACRVPYARSRYSRYSAYGYARPYGPTRAPYYSAPWSRRGY